MSKSWILSGLPSAGALSMVGFFMPNSPASTETLWTGTAVSSGVAHAVVHVMKDHFDEPDATPIQPHQVEPELQRWRRALEVTHQEIEQLQQTLADGQGSSEADIFEAHLLILQDHSILKQVEKTVREKLTCVDAVYYRLMCKHMDALRGLADSYLRERFLDIKDVTHRVMRHLRGEMLEHPMFDEPVIIVAHDLTPSDTVQLDRSKVLGFAMETGSINSHSAIIARSLGLPAVVRLMNICDELHSGDPVVLDGDEGLLILNPNEATLAKYKSLEAEADAIENALNATRHEPAITQDGQKMHICANAEFIEEMPYICDSGAAHVGLFRTEFLHLQDPDGTEDALATAYSQVVKAMAPREVIFRTLDLGGDKIDPRMNLDTEPNPFLGWRGIRASLGREDLFRRQLRALLRAGAEGPVGIMFPMVCSVEEVRSAKALLAECAEELKKEGTAIGSNIAIGAMIEIPSAAVSADLIAPEVDFFSLGTNDLIQYTLAVDRLNERVAELYQPTHPAVLRLIQMTVEAAKRAGVRACMCGEMAADVELTPLLIGLGLDELSVAAGQVARVKHAVRQLHAVDCQAFAAQILTQSCPLSIREACAQHAQEKYPELLS
jgi:phosphoenolpyruvate-protein phosphotransferase (PTS system enzyme I)